MHNQSRILESTNIRQTNSQETRPENKNQDEWNQKANLRIAESGE